MVYLKLFHLVSLFIWLGALITLTWICGQLYKKEKAAQKEIVDMGRQLHYLVALPAMIVAIASGVVLLIGKKVSMLQPWLHLKLTALFFLVVIDVIVLFAMKKLDFAISHKGSLFFKWLHLSVLVLLLIIFVSIYIIKK